MLNERSLKLGKTRSVIRELFEYGKKRKEEIGEENVFDFSLGNPSIEPPKSVKEEIINELNNTSPMALHGYTSAQGDNGVRKAIADSINKRFNARVSSDNIYLTCGAAASLTISLTAITNEGDTILAIAPYFPEYKVFTETANGNFKVVMPDSNMDIDINNLKNAIDESVKGIIINSPNNPSGIVYSNEKLTEVCDLLREKQVEYNHPIYIICDEPYRELVFNGEVPYMMNLYDNTIVCYSYSKSLSIPGERIGYIAVNPKAHDSQDIYYAICGAGRGLGYVCAPSLFQRVIKDNVDKTSDIDAYRQNRDILTEGLSKLGYQFVRPDGAFYLFVKSPNGDADDFCERAKKHELLIVSGSGFGIDTHARIAYCVDKKTIINSLPKFAELMKEYK